MRWIHGVAAPDTIWVAYPWKGETILCRGAVFSLREMPANRALSDADWRGVLKTPLAKRPAWTAAFLSR